MRFIGLDVHRDFCEVAVLEHGQVRSAGRIETTPAALAQFADGLAADDQVALEATGNALAVAAILSRRVARVALANPKAVHGISQGRKKTDKADAQALAQLLAAGFLPEVWKGTASTPAQRRLIARRSQLVRHRTREKNQIHAVLIRNLVGRPPVRDLFGTRGRAWLASQTAQALPVDEQAMVASCLRQIDFLDSELAIVDRQIASQVLGSPPMRRLLTLPGVSAVTAFTLVAAVGEIGRFPTPQHLVSYLGLDPRVSQSGNDPARHGRISKQGSGEARHVLVEAAWHAIRTTGPLRAFAQRVKSRRGTNVATVAVARKLAVLVWQLLTHQQDYAFAQPSLVREKLRRLELLCGATAHPGSRAGGPPVFATTNRRLLEKQLAAQAELAYQRLVQDWSVGGRRDAGATPGRASSAVNAAAARQDQSPNDLPLSTSSPAPHHDSGTTSWHRSSPS
jgi:transposase